MKLIKEETQRFGDQISAIPFAANLWQEFILIQMVHSFQKRII